MTTEVEYQRPYLLFNKHLETIYPALLRRVSTPVGQVERINTADQDFLDLDWYRQQAKKLIIISHGLEGNSKRAYVLGMVQAFWHLGYDALAWNYRGCGTEMNKIPRFYHSGATDDLDCVVQHAMTMNCYQEIYLIGFSLGGNLTLKYLGEPFPSNAYIKKAVAISVPLELSSSCDVLSTRANWLYVNRFLNSLKRKVHIKSAIMPMPITPNLKAIRTLREFDNQVTGPLHGFKDAADYYARNSSLYFLPNVQSQTLIINALNDPFLSPACFPHTITNSAITTLYPKQGGHVGFTQFNANGLYWSEIQAIRFIAD
jgi:uncharacterized protein